MTTNAGGNDEWVGIDDINVSTCRSAAAATRRRRRCIVVQSGRQRHGVVASANIVLNFDEAVKAGTGDITVTRRRGRRARDHDGRGRPGRHGHVQRQSGHHQPGQQPRGQHALRRGRRGRRHRGHGRQRLRRHRRECPRLHHRPRRGDRHLHHPGRRPHLGPGRHNGGDTGRRHRHRRNGFYIQDATGDGNAATSDGSSSSPAARRP